MTRLPKIELSGWVYASWYNKELDRQNACGVFTNIPQFQFAPRKLKSKILKEYQKAMIKLSFISPIHDWFFIESI